MGMKSVTYGKKRLQNIKGSFMTLVRWIGNAQKGKAVCKR
jgi:hypothetical protein